ncbi:MAG: winged helix-turn-helix transcriptional regulator [Acidimicrobiales bacterium]
MNTYGQYCPVSRSAEVLGDRWTLHIVRDLLLGTTRFNELIRGNPGLSRALLTRRLRKLHLAGVIERDESGCYQLTSAGRDLEPLIFGLAAWGARWSFGEPDQGELDPDLLLWWLHRQMDTTNLPQPRFTIHVVFSDHPKQFWIVSEHGASLCLADPGFDVDVTLRTDRTALYRTYLGHDLLVDAHRVGAVTLSGSTTAIRAFHDAFRPSPVASIVAAEDSDGTAARLGDI